MRLILAAVVGFLGALPVLADAARRLDGRWEGLVEIPGRELPLVVDLAPTPAGGWTGSIVIPGLGIKGAALANLVVSDRDVSFDLGNVLATATRGPATFNAQLQKTDSIVGEMRQGGNVAPFALTKRGAAQVDQHPRSTPVARELATRWEGEFELTGYPRQVTLTLENRGDAGAQAKFVIVGKRTTDVPVDQVVQQGALLRFESRAMQIVFEGRVTSDAAEIGGTIELGPFERPLVLRRARGS
jgi:hypothetical protein